MEIFQIIVLWAIIFGLCILLRKVWLLRFSRIKQTAVNEIKTIKDTVYKERDYAYYNNGWKHLKINQDADIPFKPTPYIFQEYKITNKEAVRMIEEITQSLFGSLTLGQCIAAINFACNTVAKKTGNSIEEMQLPPDEEYQGLKKGFEGESKVNNALKAIAIANEIGTFYLKSISPALIPYYDGEKLKVNENDIIVITNKGVFTLEIKNWKTPGLRIDAEGVVFTVGKRGRWFHDSTEDASVYAQSSMHRRNLTAFLESQIKDGKLHLSQDFNKDIYSIVKPVVVLANELTKVENESDLFVVKPPTLEKAIRGETGITLSEEDCESIYQCILNASKQYTDPRFDESELINKYCKMKKDYQDRIEFIERYKQATGQ